MVMHTFRILHLSDLHLARRPNEVGILDFLKRGKPADCTLGWLSSYHPGKLIGLSVFVHRYARALDIILITGDLATSGSNNDLQRALWFVDGPPIGSAFIADASKGFTATLQRGDVPIRVMPGNHDRFHDSAPFLPGNRAFDAIFTKYWKAGQGVQNQVVLRAKGGVDELAVLGADLTLRSESDATKPFGHLAQGKAGRSIVAQLVQETKLVRDARRPTAVVWAVHFPPKPEKPEALHELIDEEAFLTAAVDSGIGCIFCGHLHRTDQYKAVGYPSVSVNMVTTPCQGGNSPGGFCIYEVTVDNGTVIGSPKPEPYVWNGHAFVER
jgi:3',5'-cyclic AMP phosphodiesterase CpdA